MIDDLKALLAKYDPPEGCRPDWCPEDQFGGNIDDAYAGGSDDGERSMAENVRRILRKHGVEI